MQGFFYIWLMLKNLLLVFFLLYGCRVAAQLPKIVSECTVEYSITFNNVDTAVKQNKSTRILYIKGKQARVDFISNNFTQVIIADNTDTTALILKQVGNEKYMTVLDGPRWKQMNQRFLGITITPGIETKKILGYECKKFIAHLNDGSSFTLFCATGLKPSTPDNVFQLANLPGLVLEYESEHGNIKMKYTARQINFDPVPASKFEIPKKGYKMLD